MVVTYSKRPKFSASESCSTEQKIAGAVWFYSINAGANGTNREFPAQVVCIFNTCCKVSHRSTNLQSQMISVTKKKWHNPRSSHASQIHRKSIANRVIIYTQLSLMWLFVLQYVVVQASFGFRKRLYCKSLNKPYNTSRTVTQQS